MWKPIRVISRSNCKPENEEGESKTGIAALRLRVQDCRLSKADEWQSTDK